MTPFADHYMLSVLEKSWEAAMEAGLPAWRNIFPQVLPATFADKSWEILTTKGIIFRSSHTEPIEDPEAIAVVSVSLLPEEQGEEFFANAHGQQDVTLGSADNDRWSSLDLASLNIYVYATPKDLVRSLHCFIKSAVYSNQDWLMNNGFEQLWYRGATDLAPTPELSPKGVVYYGRVLRFAFSSMSDVGRIGGDIDMEPAWITVADESVRVSKYVDPSTGEEHDLDETVDGGMKTRVLP